MKLYHYSKSRSSRVYWLLEELELDYELEELPFDPRAFQGADYLELESFGKLPILVDDAVTMFESVAIVQYVLDRYAEGRLQPSGGPADYGQFLEWLQFGESTMMGPVCQTLQHTKLLPEDQRNESIAQQGRRAFKYFARELDEALANQAYLVNDHFSAADIVVGYTLFLADYCGILPSDLEPLNDYYQRLKSRAAFQKATA